MGSSGSPNPWPPGYRDCSQGICSIYCPQWCYIIFPPPPPSYSSEDDDDSGSNFSPLIIAVIGILSSAFLLIAYYTLISRYCKRRRSQNVVSDIESNQAQTNHDNYQLAAGQSGLEESVIKSIAVCKYKSGDGLVEGTECSVCLSEFVENESLRLLPKCSHAFHLPCIDTWLKSHSTCPMCRANIAAANPPNDSTLNMSALQIQRQHDMVVVVEQREELVLDVVLDPNDQVQQVGDRRSSLRGSQRQLLVADILDTDDEEDESEMVLSVGIGSSGTAEMKRSASTGKL